MNNAVPFARGETLRGAAGAINTSDYGDVEFEGMEVQFVGDDGCPLIGRIMRNVSGGTIQPGFLVTYASGYRKKRFSALSASAGQECAGVVDDQLTGGCRNGDLCIVFFKGLHKYSVSDSQGANIVVGQVLISDDEGQATALLATLAWASGATAVTDGSLGLSVMNAIGRAAEAVTYTTDTDTLKLADLNIR